MATSYGGDLKNVFYSTATLTNVTLSGNSAATGGGLFNLEQYYDVTLAGSVVANSLAGGHCAGIVIDGGGNLDDDATCPVAGPITDLDPVLADNGGPTPTHALLEGSSAIGAAAPAAWRATSAASSATTPATAAASSSARGSRWAVRSPGSRATSGSPAAT